MTITLAPTPRPSRANHLMTLTTDHVLPGLAYVFATLGNLQKLEEIAAGAGPAAGLDATTQGWLFIQRALFTVFLALIATLFMVRKRRVGDQTGFFTALGALAVHPNDARLRSEVGERLIPAVTAILGTNLIALQSFFPVTSPLLLATVPGTALEALGILLAMVALASLGRCFGVFPEVRGLVTRGPYAVVRHPLYLAEIIASLGGLLATLSLPTAAFFVVFVLLQYRRARYEEVALTQAFPEYTAYAQRTWRIIPGLH